MGRMETVEIREERADSHSSHKPGKRKRLPRAYWNVLRLAELE